MKKKSTTMNVSPTKKKRRSIKNKFEGEILTDLRNKKWKVGTSVGVGGFGEVFSASDDIINPVPPQSDFVIKVEPFMSGPLFVEVHVYSKIGKRESIDEYMIKNRKKSLGVPYYLGCGSHYCNNERYRFIVLPKYGIDLQTIFLNCGKRFNVKTAFTLAIYVIDALEYIHSHGYVHADIKASNLMLDKGNCIPVHLLDYGLSCKYINDVGRHKKLEIDLRKAHAGTLAFTSRDSHCGANSRRGDMEILCYNLIHWLTGSLPWEGITDADEIAHQKKKMMNNLKLFITECFHKRNIIEPDGLIQYIEYVNNLKFKSKPDYQYCRNLFKKIIRDAGYTFDGELSLSVNSLRPLGKLSKCNSNRENIRKFDKPKLSADLSHSRKPCTVRNNNFRLTRKSTGHTAPFDWPKILAGHPERPVGGVLPMYDIPIDDLLSNSTILSDSSNESTNSDILYTRGLDNPTPQMLQILKTNIDKFKEKHPTIADIIDKNKEKKIKHTPPNTNSFRGTNNESTSLKASKRKRRNSSWSDENENIVSCKIGKSARKSVVSKVFPKNDTPKNDVDCISRRTRSTKTSRNTTFEERKRTVRQNTHSSKQMKISKNEDANDNTPIRRSTRFKRS